MPPFFTRLLNSLGKIPRLLSTIILVLLLAVLCYIFYKTGQASTSVVSDVTAVHAVAGLNPDAAEVHTAAKDAVIPQGWVGPPVIFLICALVASFVLAGVISINQTTALGRSQVLLIGSVISVIWLAVIYGSWARF